MDHIQVYLEHLPNLKRVGASHEFRTNCIFPDHQDSTPSFFVNEETGFWFCQGCNRGGGVKKFFEFLGKTPPEKIAISIENDSQPEVKIVEPISSKVIEQFHRNLIRDNDKLGYVLRERCVSLFAVKKYLLGYDTSSERYTFPIRSRRGSFVNVKLHNSNLTPKAFFLRENVEPKLFPVSSLVKGSITICEGEFDCMALNSIGVNAITSTVGAGKKKWNSLWNLFFLDKVVKIIYDSDQAGKDGAEFVVSNLQDFAKSVEIISFPAKFCEGKDKVDVTDFLRARQNIFRLLNIVKRK